MVFLYAFRFAKYINVLPKAIVHSQSLGEKTAGKGGECGDFCLISTAEPAKKRADRTFAVYPFCGSVPEIVVETKALFRYKKGQYPNTSSVEMRFIGPIFSRTSMSRFFSSPSTMYR